jgi:hypothetical protein
MKCPIKLGIRIRLFWQHDITEDMWNHGVLFGVIFARFMGWWRFDGKERYNSFYCYIGFGLFYIRFILRIREDIQLYFLWDDVSN